MSKKLTHQYVFDYFKVEGCELLDEYSTSSRPMQYKCKCGNISRSNWNNFMRGRRCQVCLVDKRSGSNNYQWRENREEKHLEYRWRQAAYRAMKQTGLKPSCSLLICEEVFGYSIEEFKKHIKSQAGYAADGKWEIDHIFPVWAFVESGITDLKLINALDNLNVIPGRANSKKCYKFDAFAFIRWLSDKGVHDAARNSRL